MVTKMVRHYDQDERQSDAALRWDIRTVLLKSFAKHGARDFSDQQWLLQGCFSFSIQSIHENGLIQGGEESDKGRQTVFFTPLSPFGGDPDEEESRNDYTVPQKVH